MADVVLDSWQFYIFFVRVPTYKCSTSLRSLHGFVHHLEILKFVHVGCMHTQPWLYVPFNVEHFLFTPSPCCWNVTSLGFEFQYIEILKHNPCLKLFIKLINVVTSTLDFLHSPSKEIKCILLQVFVCENLAKSPPPQNPT